MSAYTGLWLRAADLAPNFYSWVQDLDKTGCFNEAGQLLMSFYYSVDPTSGLLEQADKDYTLVTTGLMLLDLNVSENSIWQDEVELTGSRIITVPGTTGSVHLHAMAPLGDGFRVSTDGQIWSLSNDGTFESVYNSLVRSFFVDGDRCYAIGDPDQLLRSLDGGATWQHHGHISPSSTRFAKIGDRTLGYLNDRIYEVNLDDFELTELEAEILVDNQITSIVEFDGEVWVTTLSGLFHRPIDSFFTPAPNPNKTGGLRLARELTGMQ